MKNLFDKQYEKLAIAYNKTIYRCLDPLVELHIGEENRDVDQLLIVSGYDELCILTAYNPASSVQTPEKNQKAQSQLILALEQAGYLMYKGENIDSDGEFPIERTCWVVGLSKIDALRMAREWRQNAFLYYRLSGSPELIWANATIDPGIIT